MDLVYFTTDLDNMITYGNSTYSNASGTSNRHGAELKMNSAIDENFYVRSGTTFERMLGSTEVFNQPIGNWDLSSATNLRAMFVRACPEPWNSI